MLSVQKIPKCRILYQRNVCKVNKHMLILQKYGWYKNVFTDKKISLQYQQNFFRHVLVSY